MLFEPITRAPTARQKALSIGARVPFDVIREPGTYVCDWSGHLLRVPGDGLEAARRPGFNMVGPEPLFATKISENPYVAVKQARTLATGLDLNVNF